ncbi:MAG: glutamine--fructose-6-phosphate transaminase (isomerizing) [Candidatus Aenigmatarchaeota archaeon]
MCGICGVIGRDIHNLPENFAASIIVEGLDILKNRGYDSVGICTLNENGLEIRKDAGKIHEINKRFSLDQMKGYVGIGHTRWATHGAANKVNAHPHLDCTGTIAVAHNGIIDNFADLRKKLEESGHKFESRTDTEIFAHLVEEKMKTGLDFEGSFKSACRNITGANALVSISTHSPETIFAFKCESPLVIGIGHEANFVTSDYYSAYRHVSEKNNGNGGLFVPLNDGEIASITPREYRIERLNGTVVDKKPESVKLNLEFALTGGFSSITEEEIHQQPETCKKSFYTQQPYLEKVVNGLVGKKRVYAVAAGTAKYAVQVASWTFPRLTKIDLKPVTSSQFEYLEDEFSPDDAMIVVSQSGETRDTLRPIKSAKSVGMEVYGITNVPGSQLTREVDSYILQQCGPEKAVASTKAFTSQVIVLNRLALALGKAQGKITEQQFNEEMSKLYRTPDLVKQVLVNLKDQVRETAVRFSDRGSFVFLGRGQNYVVAKEGRLKLQELTYKSVMAYASGESKHGFIAVVEHGFPEIIIAPPDKTRAGILGNIQEMKSREAHLIVMGKYDDHEIKEMLDPKTDVYWEMPQTHPINSTVVYTIPLQLFATYMALHLRNQNPVRYAGTPDQPRNLAKTVTVI